LAALGAPSAATAQAGQPAGNPDAGLLAGVFCFGSALRLTHMSPFQTKPRLHVFSRFGFFTSTHFPLRSTMPSRQTHFVPSAFGTSGRSQTIFFTHSLPTSTSPSGHAQPTPGIMTSGG